MSRFLKTEFMGVPLTDKEDVMRLVEAQIQGAIDLSPEEMVDAAFIMVDKINERIYEREDA